MFGILTLDGTNRLQIIHISGKCKASSVCNRAYVGTKR